MKSIKTQKRPLLITAVVVGIGLIGGISVVNALARPGITILEKPEVQEESPVLTNTTVQTAPAAPSRTNIQLIQPTPLRSLDRFAQEDNEKTTTCPTNGGECTYDSNGVVINTPGTYTLSDDDWFLNVNNSWDALITITNSTTDEIILDCESKTLHGTNYNGGGPYMGAGVDIYGNHDHITIKNCIFESFDYGIYADSNSITNTIDNLNIENNIFNGDLLVGSFYEGVHSAEIMFNSKPQGSDSIGFPTIYFMSSSNSIIHDNFLYENAGIILTQYSNNNLVYNNQLGHISSAASDKVGISISHGSEQNLVYDNDFLDIASDGTGIGLWGNSSGPEAAYDNEIYENTFTDVHFGIKMNHDVTLNDIHDNIFDNVAYNGAIMFGWNGTYFPHDNTFENNIFMNSGVGLYIEDDVYNNKIIGNNFKNNIIHATDDGINNVFDFNNTGNNWDDFDSPAENCDDTDFNGICDDPGGEYSIPGAANNTDNFPISGVPILQPHDSIVINELESAYIHPDAWDPNGDTLTYSVDDTRFNSMEACWPGSNAFGMGTNKYSAGSFSTVIRVNDGEHEATQSVYVSVRNTCKINKQGRMVCSSWYTPAWCY